MGTVDNATLRALDKGKIVGQKAPFKVKDIWAPVCSARSAAKLRVCRGNIDTVLVNV
jgi:hypothetical protein